MTFWDFFGVSQTKAKRAPKKPAAVKTDDPAFDAVTSQELSHGVCGLGVRYKRRIGFSFSGFIEEIGQ